MAPVRTRTGGRRSVALQPSERGERGRCANHDNIWIETSGIHKSESDVNHM